MKLGRVEQTIEVTGASPVIDTVNTRAGASGAGVGPPLRACAVERVGFPGFLPTGSLGFLFKENGLTPEGIAAAAHRALKRAVK